MSMRWADLMPHVRQEFPPEVIAEAQAVAAEAVLPERDETAVPFLTLARPAAGALDQAMCIERASRGYRVRLAVADLTAFVRPGGELDAESFRRGQAISPPEDLVLTDSGFTDSGFTDSGFTDSGFTDSVLTDYASTDPVLGDGPDISAHRSLLYPEQLSADAASLLPKEVRPAYVWDIQLDSDGEGTSAEVYRALVRSTDRLSYAQAQDAIERRTSDDRLSLLREVGQRRMAMEWGRGGASLSIPEQQVSLDEQGHWAVALRPPPAAQDWSVQVSLMVGMAAAEMMLHAEVGILRTMPEPEHQVVQQFRRQARALGVTWPAETLYGDLLRSLDRTNPRHLALLSEARWLFRGAGAGYSFFDGGVPELAMHAAVAAPYAHVTAPLRRLVDRLALVVCDSICRDVPVPDWVRQGLPLVPEIMSASDQRADTVERTCAEAVRAASLHHRVGETFRGCVVDVSADGALVQIIEPSILALAEGSYPVGAEVTVRLIEADVARRSIRFQVVGE